MTRACLVWAALLLAGCSYDPPVLGDHATAKYQADLKRCDADAARDAGKITGATLWSFTKSPFTYPPLKHERMRACMVRLGYALAG